MSIQELKNHILSLALGAYAHGEVLNSLEIPPDEFKRLKDSGEFNILNEKTLGLISAFGNIEIKEGNENV